VRILTILALTVAVAACGSTGFEGTDATTSADTVDTTMDAREASDMVDEDCPSPFVEGTCDLNIDEARSAARRGKFRALNGGRGLAKDKVDEAVRELESFFKEKLMI
jgi:hypothetical protein